MSFEIVLPLPPSANNIYENAGKGRRISDAYAAWRAAAVSMIKRNVPMGDAVIGKFEVRITVPAKMQGDIDNRIKPVVDALVKSNRVLDDHNLWRVTAERVPMASKLDCRVAVVAA